MQRAPELPGSCRTKNSKRGVVISVNLEAVETYLPQIHNINGNCMNVALIVEYIFVGKFNRRKDGPDDELEDNWDCQDEYFRVLFVQRIRWDQKKKMMRVGEEISEGQSRTHTS
jgi:hypothetical protein